MFPLIKQLYQRSVEQNDASSLTIAKEFGGILEGLQSSLEVTDSTWLIETFTAMSNRGLPAKMADSQQAKASQVVHFA